MRTSEWVSIGHPDKICDYVTSSLLDMYFQKDSFARFAVEVLIKDNHVCLAGEVTSNYNFTNDEIIQTVKKAINHIGYTKKYQEKWGKENVICADDIEVDVKIKGQSEDIACGVNRECWGDQGIFWGYANINSITNFMPHDIWLARKIGLAVYNSPCCGIDVKTQVSITDELEVFEVIVAAPLLDKASEAYIENIVRSLCAKYMGNEPSKLIINGTGRYVKHSTIGDCGVTGRKIVADLYGCNCPVGGGALWGKDYTKADVTLNAYARKCALDFIKEHNDLEEVKCLISCCIGKQEIIINMFDYGNNLIDERIENATPRWVAGELGLLEPSYAEKCFNGLPYSIK